MVISVSKQDVSSCCSSDTFADKVSSASPFGSVDCLLQDARRVWWNETPTSEWLQAFAAHPRIGDVAGLRKKFGAFAEMSKGEQATAAASATEEVLKELADWNKRYEDKFGHIFIICASGKSAQEMLAAVRSRYSNAPFAELGIAAAEQMKITELRLRAVVSTLAGAAAATGSSAAERRTGTILSHLRGATPVAAPSPSARSPITTHVLDIALGRPAEGVPVSLQHQDEEGVWQQVAAGATNKDGRIGDLLAPGSPVTPGRWRIQFDTSSYMARCKTMHPSAFPDVPFYPTAVVYFSISPAQVHEHFHVPLTWSPFGYSTYRGS